MNDNKMSSERDSLLNNCLTRSKWAFMINPVCSRPALAEKQKTKQNGVQYN